LVQVVREQLQGTAQTATIQFFQVLRQHLAARAVELTPTDVTAVQVVAHHQTVIVREMQCHLVKVTQAELALQVQVVVAAVLVQLVAMLLVLPQAMVEAVRLRQ
jgi:hypothetical protein